MVHRPAVLYPRLLGEAWQELHPAIRSLHLTDEVAIGRFEFHRGRGVVARLTCRALGLPASSTTLEVRLMIARDADSERWMRTFGQRPLVTVQRGLPDGTLAERLGALELRFHLRVAEGMLTYVQVGAGLIVGRMCVALPRWLSPRVDAREACLDGQRAHVQVAISVPVSGLVMSYEGCVQVKQ